MKSANVSVRPDLLPVFLKTVIQRDLFTPGSLNNGRPDDKLGLTPRERLGAFLVCVVGQFLDPDNAWTIASDPESQDGVVCCYEGEKQGDAIALEQVYIPRFETDELQRLIEQRVESKSSRGEQYSKGRHLVVFCSKDGQIDLAKVSEFLDTQNAFLSYWVIARVDSPKWNYLVATPKTSGDPCLAYKVSIADDFLSWEVDVLGRLTEKINE